jgi:hypothetical protein
MLTNFTGSKILSIKFHKNRLGLSRAVTNGQIDDAILSSVPQNERFFSEQIGIF